MAVGGCQALGSHPGAETSEPLEEVADEKVIGFVAAFVLVLAVVTPAFAAADPPKVPPRGTEGPDIRAKVPPKGTEGPDIRAKVPQKGLEGPDIR